MNAVNKEAPATLRPTKVLWIREPYLRQILAGRKTVEVRVGYPNILRLEPGSRLKLNDEHPAILRRIRVYAGFDQLLAHEDPAAIAPDLSPDQLADALHQIYPPDKEALGAVALEIGLPRRYDAVLFDMGYTLIYFEPLQEVIVQETLREIGIERSVDQIMNAVRVVWGSYYQDAETATFPATPEYDRDTQEALIRGLLSELGLEVDEETLHVYLTAAESRFSRPGVLRPYPEVGGLLQTLKMRDYRLGIVSNWSWDLGKRLQQVDLDRYFEVVWASAYAGCNKPHPGIFHQALARMAPPPRPERVLYVGDSYQHDVVGARAAGINPVLLDRDSTAADPDCPVISDLWGLLGLLGEQNA
jgi:putative hydrolase of the HAD superfamily